MSEEQQAQDSTAAQQDHGTVDPGGMLTSFDELEAIETSRSAQIEQEAKEEVAKEEIKQEIKGEESDGEVKADADAETKAEAEASSKDEEVSKTEEQIEEEAAKLFKALVGEDEEVEIRGDAKVAVKVDGEETQMTIEELVNSASGQEAIKKRFGEIGTAKKDLLNERSKWSQEKAYFDLKLQNALNLLNQDPLAGFASFVEMAGMDSGKWLEAFVPKMTEQFQSMAEMTDDERRIYEQGVLTQQREANIKAKEANLATQEAQTQVLATVNQLKAQHDIDDDTFKEKFLELETLQKRGKINGEITPKFVAEVVVYDRIGDKIKAVAEVVRPSLLQDAQSVGDLTEVIMNQDPDGEFTEDDIKDIIIQAFPQASGTEETLSKKVRKSSKSQEAINKKQKAAVDPNNDPVSFDDL